MAAAPGPPAAAHAAQQRRGADEQELDVRALQGKQDKIKELMRRDPRFIGRLIVQLDHQMHGMLHERHRRLEQIRADQAAIDRIDETIKANIQPCLDRLSTGIALKTQLKEQVTQQLEQDMQRFRDVEREAAALMSKARHANSKLQGRTAQAALQEARGFTATVPTTEIIRGKRQGASENGTATAAVAAAGSRSGKA